MKSFFKKNKKLYLRSFWAVSRDVPKNYVPPAFYSYTNYIIYSEKYVSNRYTHEQIVGLPIGFIKTFKPNSILPFQLCTAVFGIRVDYLHEVRWKEGHLICKAISVQLNTDSIRQ